MQKLGRYAPPSQKHEELYATVRAYQPQVGVLCHCGGAILEPTSCPDRPVHCVFICPTMLCRVLSYHTQLYSSDGFGSRRLRLRLGAAASGTQSLSWPSLGGCLRIGCLRDQRIPYLTKRQDARRLARWRSSQPWQLWQPRVNIRPPKWLNCVALRIRTLKNKGFEGTNPCYRGFDPY